MLNLLQGPHAWAVCRIETAHQASDLAQTSACMNWKEIGAKLLQPVLTFGCGVSFSA